MTARHTHLRVALAIAMVAWANNARADYATALGPPTPEFLFYAAAILAIPTAIACVLAEAILPRRPLPFALTCGCAAFALVAIATALFPGARGGWREVLWFVTPPIATLALRGARPRPLPRLAAGCGVAIATVLLGSRIDPSKETLAVLAGGAMTCLPPWVATVLLLHALGKRAPDTGDARANFNALSAVLPPRDAIGDAAAPLVERLETALSRSRGLGWWLATSLVLYVGIGGLISLGGLRGVFLYMQAYSFLALFNLPMGWVDDYTPWWKLGLIWSLLVGSAAWGVAGLVGAFDPGRLRVLRFAAVVFGGALLLWSVSIAWNTIDVEAAERAANGR